MQQLARQLGRHLAFSVVHEVATAVDRGDPGGGQVERHQVVDVALQPGIQTQFSQSHGRSIAEEFGQWVAWGADVTGGSFGAFAWAAEQSSIAQ